MIVDVRTYTLKPGTVGEYFAAYEKEGLRVQLRHLGRLVGYYMTEVGPLNQILHIWAYDNMADRERRRAAMQADPAWKAWLAKGRDYLVTMENKVMVEAPFSRTKWTTPEELG
jgi:hypothetical protein